MPPRSSPSTPPVSRGKIVPVVPGSWKHPKYTEITQRKNARTFTDKQFAQVARNCAALLASFVLTWFVKSDRFKPFVPESTLFIEVYTGLGWLFFAIRCLFAYNVLEAVTRLFRSPDLIADIPLTPTQRASLGLPPSASAPGLGTPMSTTTGANDSSMYVTPPRHNKASPANSPGTPLSGSRFLGSGKARVMANGSPVGPGQNAGSISGINNGSPLNGVSAFGSSTGRRSSFGSPTPKGQGTGMTATLQGNPSVIASGKWLFEQKARRSQFF